MIESRHSLFAAALLVAGFALPAMAQTGGNIKAVPLSDDEAAMLRRQITDPGGADGPGFDLNWNTIDGGGATYLTGGAFQLGATAGQPDAGTMSGGAFTLGGGFWHGVAPSCYPDCDGVGGLTANDFQCFLDAFVANLPYADCDGVGGLTANDFQCFLNAFVAGCS